MNPSAWSTTKGECLTDLGEPHCRDLFTPYVFIKLKMKLCGYKSSLEFSNMLLKDSTLVPAAMCLCNVQREAVTGSLDHADTETVFSQQSFCRSNTYRHINQTAHRYSVINRDKTTPSLFNSTNFCNIYHVIYFYKWTHYLINNTIHNDIWLFAELVSVLVWDDFSRTLSKQMPCNVKLK